MPTFRRLLSRALLLSVAALAGCSSLPGGPAPRVRHEARGGFTVRVDGPGLPADKAVTADVGAFAQRRGFVHQAAKPMPATDPVTHEPLPAAPERYATANMALEVSHQPADHASPSTCTVSAPRRTASSSSGSTANSARSTLAIMVERIVFPRVLTRRTRAARPGPPARSARADRPTRTVRARRACRPSRATLPGLAGRRDWVRPPVCDRSWRLRHQEGPLTLFSAASACPRAEREGAPVAFRKAEAVAVPGEIAQRPRPRRQPHRGQQLRVAVEVLDPGAQGVQVVAGHAEAVDAVDDDIA